MIDFMLLRGFDDKQTDIGGCRVAFMIENIISQSKIVKMSLEKHSVHMHF